MISNILQILGLQPRISKFFSITRIFFLTVGQNNFCNKIPFVGRKNVRHSKTLFCYRNSFVIQICHFKFRFVLLKWQDFTGYFHLGPIFKTKCTVLFFCVIQSFPRVSRFVISRINTVHNQTILRLLSCSCYFKDIKLPRKKIKSNFLSLIQLYGFLLSRIIILIGL